MSRALVLLFVLAPGVAGAAPLPKYGEPAATLSRVALAASVEEQVQRMAVTVASRRPAFPDGRGVSGAAVPFAPLVSDGRLQAAMDQVLAHLPPTGAPPAALIERAMWFAGLVEPMPYLITMTVPDGAEADVLEQLSRLLPPVLENGRYRRVAASALEVPLAGGKATARRLLLALQESFVELSPVARAVPSGARVTIVGKVLPPFDRPGFFVTTPDGAVQRIDTGGEGARDDNRFRATFRCSSVGAHQVEIVGEDRWGDAVLANFPVYCGAPAPTALELPPRDAEAPILDVAGAEARLFELLRVDRAHARLPSLTLDSSLAAVARAHSEEMRDRNFFGHVSPTTGTAADRLRGANIQPMRVLENLARAGSPIEVERGLMESPSHRANILSSDVERVGIGVALGPAPPPGGGERELYVTQLYAHLPAPLDPRSADLELRQRLDHLRRSAHRTLLKPDAALDALAQEVAESVAAGQSARASTVGGKSATGASDPVERALPQLSERFRWVKTVVAQAAELAQLGLSPALLDVEATHAGVAAVIARAGARSDLAATSSGGVYLVVLLAAAR